MKDLPVLLMIVATAFGTGVILNRGNDVTTVPTQALSSGMTQSQVRARYGEPTRRVTQPTGEYWVYSEGQIVVFNQGRVSSSRGLALATPAQHPLAGNMPSQAFTRPPTGSYVTRQTSTGVSRPQSGGGISGGGCSQASSRTVSAAPQHPMPTSAYRRVASSTLR